MYDSLLGESVSRKGVRALEIMSASLLRTPANILFLTEMTVG